MVARKKNHKKLTENKYFKFPFIFHDSQSPKNCINPKFQKKKNQYYDAIKKSKEVIKNWKQIYLLKVWMTEKRGKEKRQKHMWREIFI